MLFFCLLNCCSVNTGAVLNLELRIAYLSQNMGLSFSDEHPPELNVEELHEIRKKDDAHISNKDNERISP